MSGLAPAVAVPSGEDPPPPRTTSAALLGAARELLIEHGEDLYRLRLTATGKLILTK